MKKRVICVFSLVLWALAACTLLSLRIEELMITKVTACKPENQGSFLEPKGSTLPLDCLFFDETGAHLYAVIEGNGWESGTRVMELPQNNYTIGQDTIETGYYADVVRYASKPPRNGGVAEVVRTGKRREDLWLALFPDGVPALGELPETISVEGQNGGTLLLSVENAEQPFMTDRAGSLLFSLELGSGPEASYYSVLDVNDFVREMPLVALLLALLLVPLCLWAYSCFLAKPPRKNRLFLLLNGGIGIVSLGALAVLLHVVELPSSLLPQNSIFDFSHYAGEFREAFAALDGFAAAGNQAAAAALQNADRARLCSLTVLLGGILLAAGLIAVEAVFLKRRARSGQRARHLEK